jgi:hypothetical protein
MAERKRMLASFYGGPVWKAHSEAANATMLDSDNVLLLRPEPAAGNASGSGVQRHGLLIANIQYVNASAIEGFANFFDQTIKLRLAETGAHIFAAFRTENAPNTFPKLPVREGETVFIWLAAFPDVEHYRHHLEILRAGPDWREHAPENVVHQFARKPEVLLLKPTARSQLSI